MKKLTRLLSILLVLSTLLVFLVSCDKSKGIKEAFADAGYTVTTVSANDKTVKSVLALVGYGEEALDDMDDYENEVILCIKGIDITSAAVIFKYPSASELRDELTDDDSDTFYQKQKEAGRINGNCWLIAGGDAAVELFR